jgi:uracil-DNA glycosylase family 4
VDLRETIKTCKRCSLCRQLNSGVDPLPGMIYGIGPAPVETMIVCESPNMDNMILEHYEVSLAQKTFIKILKEAGIQKYYITNIIKCYSDENYKKYELEACYKLFQQEINEIKPKRIITSGLLPLKTIINQSKVDKLKEWAYNSIVSEPIAGTRIPLLPMYSGNYYYQNGQKIYNNAVKKLKEFVNAN